MRFRHDARSYRVSKTGPASVLTRVLFTFGCAATYKVHFDNKCEYTLFINIITDIITAQRIPRSCVRRVISKETLNYT